MVAGLLNTDDPDFAAALVELAADQFTAAAAAGDRHRARLLLRFFAALAAANTLHASSVLGEFLSVVGTACAVADTGAQLILARRYPIMLLEVAAPHIRPTEGGGDSRSDCLGSCCPHHGVLMPGVVSACLGDDNDSGRQWQPYTNYLVYAALIALGFADACGRR